MNNQGQTITPPQAFKNALQHYQAGRYVEAEAVCSKILETDSEYFEALHLLGIIACQIGKNEQGIEFIRRAIQRFPSNPFPHNNLGVAFRKLNRLDEAEACYKKALALKPDYVAAHYNLGMVFYDRGRLDEAEACYKKALALKPDYVAAHYNLGMVFYDRGRLDEAEACYQKALALKPDSAEIVNNLGTVFQQRSHFDEAATCYQKALMLKPDYVSAHYNLGTMLQKIGRLDHAEACYQKALALKPDFAEARWMLTMSKIPSVRGLNADLKMERGEFIRELAELESWFEKNKIEHGHKCVGLDWPFYLAYQEENNRDLLNQHGSLCVRLMERWEVGRNFVPEKTDATDTIRVGIVTAYIHNHSVWNAIIKGWLSHLDREQFELYVFHVGSKQDAETVWAQSQANFFAQGPKILSQWVEDIRQKQPDVLIYPEIGMDSMTIKLASLRLAPVQVAAWGHPETTGLSTMDYYLSAEDFEPLDAQQNYSERLVSLPHLGCCYHPKPINIVDPDFKYLGIDTEAPILLCPGTPFKYFPQHDRVLIEIARRVERCQLVFFVYNDVPELSEKLRRRFEAVFENSGLDFNDYGVFATWQPMPAFYGLMQRADVYLDTIGFSGFNTAMHAIECSLPIVTREGRFMRGRLAAGILRRMGLPELVAMTEEEYITLAVRLAHDADYRQEIRKRIKTYRHALFDDLAPIRAFEEFLKDARKRH